MLMFENLPEMDAVQAAADELLAAIDRATGFDTRSACQETAAARQHARGLLTSAVNATFVSVVRERQRKGMSVNL